MIFSPTRPTDLRPKTNIESSFAFLDRSSRPEIARVRDFLEQCAFDYPESETPELVARITSGNDIQFRSSTFELLLHAFLLRLGCQLEPHPKLSNGSRSRPDFLVRSEEGHEFYLEAVLASERDGTDAGAEARKAMALDYLQQATHRDFMVAIESEGDPTTQPSGKKLARATLDWLDTLNPDEVQVITEARGLEAAPSFPWSYEGWSLTLRPIPLKPERRGKATSLIGALSGEGRLVDAWTPIRDAIEHKGAKYGDLGAPLLVAINFDSFHLDPIDEMQALYGEERVLVSNDPEVDAQLVRAPNGAWRGRRGPRGRRVSGLWSFNDLTPYSIAARRQTIYMNPWALYPLPESLYRLPHVALVGEKMEQASGLSLREVFGLHERWPE